MSHDAMIGSSLFSLLQPVGLNPAAYPYLGLVALLGLVGILGGRALSPRPSDLYPATVRSIVAAALIIGALLRFYQLDFGVPQFFHPDENQKSLLLTRMMSRSSIDPQFTLHPPLLLHLSWLVSSALKVVGVSYGDLTVRNLVAGRVVNAIAGTASVALLYVVGRRAFSPTVGALAAMLLAVSPLHVTCSRYMKEDALFVGFVLGAVALVLNTEKKWSVPAAALVAGLAGGAKYTGILSLPSVLAAPWLSARGKRPWLPDWRAFRHLLLSLPLFVVGLVLGVSQVLLGSEQLQLVLAGFLYESRHALRGHIGLVIDPWSQLWMYHLSRSVVPGVGILPASLGVIGLGFILWRRRPKELMIAANCVLFYLAAEFARSKPPPQADRYVLPAIPFLLLAASAVAVACCSSRRAVALMFGLLVLPPFVTTINYARELRPDTRESAEQWMKANLPVGTKLIVVGGPYLPRIPRTLQSTALRRAIGRRKANIVARLRASPYEYLVSAQMTPQRFAVENMPRSRRREAWEAIERELPQHKRFEALHGTYGFHNPRITIYRLK